jgi:nitrogen fixation protein NifU and related proteins
MTLDVRALYQEAILDHSRYPRNYGALEAPTHTSKLRNDGCSDEVTVTLKVVDGTILAAAFEGSGCAISTASASMMTECILGKSLRDAAGIGELFHRELNNGTQEPLPGELGKLIVFGGVRQVPSRVKCVLLPWWALEKAVAE